MSLFDQINPALAMSVGEALAITTLTQASTISVFDHWQCHCLQAFVMPVLDLYR